jgi:heme-degrading monooxygenase HmoA
MFVHIWKMRARKKRAEAYEKFGRQVTMLALKKLDGCLDAHFLKVAESRKPEYLWLVFWRDREALEAARTSPVWRDQIKKFEAGEFYKSVPLEYVCESLGSFGPAVAEKRKKPRKSEKPEATEESEPAAQAPVDSTPEGE